MKRWGRLLGAAFCLLLLLAALATWNAVFRAPGGGRLPMPEGLVSLESPAGESLLAEAGAKADLDALVRHFVTQSRPAYCGVASAVTVLNAMPAATAPSWTQSTFFTDAARRVRHPLKVTFGGMNLAELDGLLRAHDVDTTRVYASDSSADAFRSVLRQNLEMPDDYVIVNYERAALGQPASGHISPLGAYDATSDRVLVLDVASYKYPATWVPVDALWKAMDTLDSSAGKTRGYIVVSARPKSLPVIPALSP